MIECITTRAHWTKFKPRSRGRGTNVANSYLFVGAIRLQTNEKISLVARACCLKSVRRKVHYLLAVERPRRARKASGFVIRVISVQICLHFGLARRLLCVGEMEKLAKSKARQKMISCPIGVLGRVRFIVERRLNALKRQSATAHFYRVK